MHREGRQGFPLPPGDRAPAFRLPCPVGGLRIGLLGGSFNPPHAGHRHVSLLALTRLHLDRIWWLVTPGNPLKDGAALAPMPQRVAASQREAAHPRIFVTDLETTLGTRYTWDLLSRLVARCPETRFVWIMGADNLIEFDRWHRWRDIAGIVPIAVIDRPGATWRATQSRAAQALSAYRLREADAGRLADCRPPAMAIIHGPRSGLSSTVVRAARSQEA